MRSTRFVDKPDNPYFVIAIGATWFALLALVIALATRVSLPIDGLTSWRMAVGIVDIHLAALTTAVSLLLFSGLWTVKPETPLGRYAMRGVIALLVVINWAAWCVALWLH